MEMEKMIILVSDKLRLDKNNLESDLEYILNDNEKPTLKTDKIIDLLEKISIIDNTQNLWEEYISNIVKLKENGDNK
jgi:hypothetical protein